MHSKHDSYLAQIYGDYLKIQSEPDSTKHNERGSLNKMQTRDESIDVFRDLESR